MDDSAASNVMLEMWIFPDVPQRFKRGDSGT
jgi:hypothetical protein